MDKVSVLIPARNEIYLERTIRNILENAEGEIEILVALDGYLPDPPFDVRDNRVIFYPFKEAVGHRKATNELAKVATGEFVMKIDAHCAVGKGFDVILAKDCEYDWTVIPRMYNLDIETWKPKLFDDFKEAVRKGKVHDYISMEINDKSELRTQYYPHRFNKELHYSRKDILIDDTLSCMGSSFFMRKDRFWELGGCDEEMGGWGQQAIELACKAWLSGGSLKVNKKTWYAHWFRADQGWPYPISGNAINKSRAYSTDLWLNDKWPLQKRPFKWLIEKFSPPGWKDLPIKDQEIKAPEIGTPPSQEEIKQMFIKLYWQIIKRGNIIKWHGHKVLKFPNDLAIYQRAIYDNKPDFIVETGTKWGGSATFFADMCELNGHGQVITVDIAPLAKPEHPRITYIVGDSKSPETLEKIKALVGKGSVMVILDSDHSYNHVKDELYQYSQIVTKGQFLVVEDCYNKFGELHEPGKARDWLLTKTRKFVLTNTHERYFVGLSMGGWLKRV